ncbi:MAG: glycoside hydrolase family 9 protein [bacterium]|nr:glycoside hydrolase family 9 protein [bacterium]
MHRLFLMLIGILIVSLWQVAAADTYIRVNQIGFLPSDSKVAVVMSHQDLTETEANIINQTTGTSTILRLSKDHGPYLAFPHHFRVDFSQVRETGVYTIQVDSINSSQFQIDTNLYTPLCDSLLRFFQVQRCGENPALFHALCHRMDATSVVGYHRGKNSIEVDLTGGWHDAGDYVKFTLTTAYTAYLLLLTHEYSPNLIPDRDGNGYSDLLDEAKIGLDWLIKAHFLPGKVLTQVTDLTDHSVGWRMPENDPLENQRPAYYAPSQAYSASTVAALAIGAARFQAVGDTSFAAKCLLNAITIYNGIPDLPVWASGPDSMYVDRSCIDNYMLAASELFRATGIEVYREEANVLFKHLPIVHWISWGDLGGIAKIRIFPFNPEVRAELNRSLQFYAAIAQNNPFSYPLANYPWGSAAMQSGVAMLAQLYESATQDSSYRWLAERQRDFLLGNNSHGVSFFTGIGSEYPRNPHHQIAYLTKRALPGTLVAGYCSREQVKRQRIHYEGVDRFEKFQSQEAVYFDDRNDFLCNEPTIGNNAQALWMMAWFAKRERKP